ncbi:MAG: winged helix-turn-helix domain-containing protein [Thermogutta sp.]|nr:winged helix-turn-helix domain-containing protein [Thermogutta sp.]
MAAAEDHVARIGQTAGLVWNALHSGGAMSLSRLIKEIGRPRDEVMQAVGWLAREDKLTFQDQGRTRKVALKESG